MAVDVPAAHARTLRARPVPAILTAVPARIALAGIVALSFAGRMVAAAGHSIPVFFPDEYIYSSLARSIGESGRVTIRGEAAHFPALLEPLLAAPFWLFHDPVLAYRLTQAEHALAMSLAAVPAYLLARRLGLGAAWGLACAALAVACPDLLYVSFVIAEPIAYPLALGAIYAGVCALDRPSRRAQLAFLALAGLAVTARVQYVFLPVAFLAAALVVERGRVRTAVRSVRLTLVLLALPLLGVVAVGPAKALGYYSVIRDFHLGGSLVSWIATDALLLAYASGWILVPGALVGIWYALARPQSRAEAAFGALFTFTAGALLLEAGLYASNGSDRFQERYLFLLIPLAAPAFALFVHRAGAGRRAVPVIAFGLLVLSARFPLSGFTAGDAKQDSPFLFTVFQLERHLGAANGSLVVALLAALLAVGAGAVAFRRDLAPVAIGLTVAVACAVSAAAVGFDLTNNGLVHKRMEVSSLRWVDRAQLGPVDLVVTDGSQPAGMHENLIWNTSLRRLVLLQALPVDAFDAPGVEIARDGRMTAKGDPVDGAMLVGSYGTQSRFTGVARVAHARSFDLYRRAGVPRISLLAAGLYDDGWLAKAGRITVWPLASGKTRGTLTLRLSLPPGPGALSLRLRAPGYRRTVTVQAGGHTTLKIAVPGPNPWVLRFRATQPARLPDGRPIAMRAAVPSFN